MNPIRACPECESVLMVIKSDDASLGDWFCSACQYHFFTKPAPNEAEKEIHIELPSGAIARVTLEGAKDQKLLDALNEMMIAVANQFSAPNEYERLRAQKVAILKKQESAENARLAAKLAEMEKERNEAIGLNGIASEICANQKVQLDALRVDFFDLQAERDSLRQELEKMRGEG